MLVPAVAVLIVLGGAFLFGVLLGSLGKAKPKSGTNDSDADCTNACDQLQLRRDEVCAAEADLERAETAAKSANRVFWALFAAALVAGVAAAVFWGITWVPGIGTAALPLTIVTSIAAGLLGTGAAYALGALIAAEGKVRDRADSEADAKAAAREAVAILRERCPSEEADACIGRPRGC